MQDVFFSECNDVVICNIFNDQMKVKKLEYVNPEGGYAILDIKDVHRHHNT